MEKTKQLKKMTESDLDNQHISEKRGSIHNKEHFSASMTQDIGQAEGRTSNKPEGHQCVGSFASSEQEDSSDSSDDEAENFSDIDDVEVDGYLHNEEEKELKKIIWEGMNREYLEAQAAKEAAATAAKEAYKANSLNGSEDLLDAKEFAKATAAALAKSRKERRRRNAGEAKNKTPETTQQMSKRKVLSSKVNYEALEALYSSDQDSGKRQKIESDAAGACDLPNNIENHAVDPGATEDGDGSGAFEDGMYAEVSYDDYDGNGDEDFGYYEDFDFSF
ncbi:Brf1-like TBP-binding domain [Musa troglodytarum]|uniref:Brf1-like TBP-binding domain n=1 Tax=Musa troglodytarum TaxID=320322 RepID=A0A9E7IBF4_9LILI|nr:Brf1-like TBP-binding domain [Musa troglodytarum]